MASGLVEKTRRLRPAALRFAGPWLVWWALFGTLFLGALTFSSESWPDWFGGEATYLFQAASLAWEQDLETGQAELERFVPRGDRGGEAISGKGSLIYSLYLAPFVRVAPQQGPAVANTLLLVVAAWLATKALQRNVGERAPLLVVLFVFGSVTFRNVFVAQPDILLLAATVAAFALVYGREEQTTGELPEIYEAPDTGGKSHFRWLVVGALLMLPALHEPLYLALFLPAAVATPEHRRKGSLIALGAGAAALLAVVLLFEWAFGGSWGLDTMSSWKSLLPADERTLVDGHLFGWNVLYFFVGRSVGVVPYFLPLILILAFWSGGTGRSTLVVTTIALAFAFVLLAPFNFWGGPGAIANRWFAPLYGALWMVPARNVLGRWIALTALMTGLFLWPSWLAPRAYPVGSDGNYHHTAGLARRNLPYETTQRELPAVGELQQGLFWARASGRMVYKEGNGDRFELSGEGPAEVFVASPEPLVAIHLEFGPTAPAAMQVTRGKLGDTVYRPGGGVGFDLFAPEPRARHPMWWTDTRQHLYFFSFDLPGSGAGPHAFAISFSAWEDVGGDR